MIEEMKLWIRVRLSAITAAIDSLRYHGKDKHDDAREEKRAHEDLRSIHTRAEADKLHQAAKEFEEARDRALSRERTHPEDGQPPRNDDH
jgi:hypothetical protein